MSGRLDWQEIRPTIRRTAVWLTSENAQEVADEFGGTVEVVKDFGRAITRLTLGTTSGPAYGWVMRSGEWVFRDDEWEVAE